MKTISLPNARAAMRGPDLHSYDRIVIASSGGKDSVASLLTVLDAGVPPERIDVYHHDVDGDGPSFMDWPSATAYYRAFTRALVDLGNGVRDWFSSISGPFFTLDAGLGNGVGD